MSKNILMIAYTNYSTDARVIKEAETAIKSGFQVDFIALKEEAKSLSEKINGVNVIKINQYQYKGKSNIRHLLSYMKFFLKCTIKTTILHIKNKYKIIHVNNMPDFLVFCAIVPKLCGSKIILDIHDHMPAILLTNSNSKYNNIKYKLLLFQEKLSSQFADSIITVHEPIKNDMLIKDGIPANKITVITNFADDILFHIKGNYSLNTHLKLISHGTISDRTGLDDVLMAIRNSKNRHKLHFKIIGKGNFGNRLKQLIIELSLENIVEYEDKFYDYRELPSIIKTYHLGIASYVHSLATDYMLPVKMLEYILLGIPFITIPNKAIKYFLTGDECFFYNPVNISSLTDVLDNIIKNPYSILEKREKLIATREKFLWSNEQKKYVNHLHHLINR